MVLLVDHALGNYPDDQWRARGEPVDHHCLSFPRARGLFNGNSGM
jgi:hypothetical protein